jgi:DNA-binding NarL/FixJ family response regulator
MESTHPSADGLRTSVMVDSRRRAQTARKVLIIHPERLVRDALIAAIDTTADLRCIGTEVNGHAGIADAVLLGFDVLDRYAIAGMDDLCGRLPNVTTVATVRAADEEQVTAALELGVVVVSTAAPLEIVLDALRGHELAVIDTLPHETIRRTAESGISPRELDVLRLLGDGLTPDTAARRLGITAHTCRDHLKSLRAKLGCATTLQAVVTAARLGLLAGFAPTEAVLRD